ncbi:MAG: thioredoxin [Bacteroidales bacterium]|nr:thioredoxin [Bacteroidales bacterium]
MNDFEKLINESKPTLVDFFATWCVPCKMQSPIIEEVKNEIGDKANVVKVDIDKNRALATQYNVQSIPTLILFVKGEPVWRAVGLQQRDALVKKLYEHITVNA